MASVKLKQIVRASGQPATQASTTSVGARKSQAARDRERAEATCAASAARPGRPGALRTHRRTPAAALDALQVAVEAAASACSGCARFAESTSCTAFKNAFETLL